MHKSMKVVEDRLKEMGITRSDFIQAINIHTNTYTNWKTRGVASSKLPLVARYLKCDPVALQKGQYKAENRPVSDTLSQDAKDIALAYDFLPEGMKHHISIIINDYVASVAPLLQPLYQNASKPDQTRFNRLIEIAQEKDRKKDSS